LLFLGLFELLDVLLDLDLGQSTRRSNLVLLKLTYFAPNLTRGISDGGNGNV
jgi:hypothetical protein